MSQNNNTTVMSTPSHYTNNFANHSLAPRSVLDPLEYYTMVHCAPHIVDMISQHFDFQELMKLSTVCTSWHDFTVESPSQMKKIKFVINNKQETERLKITQRKYQSIKINLEENPEDFRAFALLEIHHMHSLTSFEICTSNGDAMRPISQLSSKYEYKIEELTLTDVLSTNAFQAFTLQHLKTFNANNVNKNLVYNIIRLNPNVTKLSLRNVRDIDKMLKLLSSNTSLHLQELTFSEYSDYNFDPLKVNFCKFLQLQMSSMKVLKLDMWVGFPALNLILVMTNLNHLELFELAKSKAEQWKTVDLQMNSSVRYLRLQDINGGAVNRIFILEKILQACVNVTELRIYERNEFINRAIEKFAPRKLRIITDL